jgi:tetratricopeptide (TPR) repeat protein
MRFRIISLVLLLLLTVSIGSSVAQPAAPSSPQADIALQRALKHYQAGKLNEAAGLLRGFIVTRTETDLVDKAYYHLACIHRDLGNPSLALEYLDRISASSKKPADVLLLGELNLQMGNPAMVVDRLLDVDTQNWTLPQRQERYLSLGEGLLSLDEPQKALFFLQQAMVTEGDESPRDVLSRIYTLLNDRFDNADLAEAAFMYQDSPVAYLSMLQLGWRALAAGQKELAREWADAAMSAPIGFAYREEALALQAQLSDPTKLQRAIGVLLPLSGRYAAFGERVQRGMELAMEDFRPHIPVRFIFRDTTGDEIIASQQLAELAISDRVMGVAGPLVGNAAQGAVRRTNRERVPLLTMSQREGLAASSLYTRIPLQRYSISIPSGQSIRSMMNCSGRVRTGKIRQRATCG